MNILGFCNLVLICKDIFFLLLPAVGRRAGCVIEVGRVVCCCMPEGMLPANTELILGLCFRIINLGLYIFWNLHNCKEHLDTCISSGASCEL